MNNIDCAFKINTIFSGSGPLVFFSVRLHRKSYALDTWSKISYKNNDINSSYDPIKTSSIGNFGIVMYVIAHHLETDLQQIPAGQIVTHLYL